MRLRSTRSLLGRRPRAPIPIIVLMALPALLVMPQLSAEAPADPAFQRTWARTDQPVAQGAVSRTWMWGPEAFTGALSEPYAEGSGAQRMVQYFDKSRMEITNPNADSGSIWYVTNGLLVVELITGNMQVGDNAFESRFPAAINVAGDADDQAGPTYATFAELLDAAPLPVGTLITGRVSRDGAVSDDPSLAARGVSGSYADDVTGHTIAGPFWSFMTSSGVVWDGAANVEAPLFENPYFATGRPITEAYWATVKVGGAPKDVLIQCFERRCLTYTPENPPGWQVEAGNVGQHYYAWRYERAGSGCPWNEPFPATLVLGAVTQTTLHFQVEGCEVAISRIEIRTSEEHTRNTTFEPPMLAWSPGPVDAASWEWTGSGTFSGQTETVLGDEPATLEQQGAYSATMRVHAMPQVGGPIFWVRGTWFEDGGAQVCVGEVCQDLAWGSPREQHWFWAVNTLTGAVGATPDDVR